MRPDIGFLPVAVKQGLALVHPSWLDAIIAGLKAMHDAAPAYFEQLCAADFLPTNGRLFAAFALPIDQVKYVLVGEGPYPREESATGVCFMDGAVDQIWSSDGKGLSKRVNRATSLRNFIKMLLVAEGTLSEDSTAGVAMEQVAVHAVRADSGYIQTLSEMEQNLYRQGFLLLNASLVFRTHVAPVKDGRSWQLFFRQICLALHQHHAVLDGSMPALILWGKIAESLNHLQEVAMLPKIIAEHPYNLSFIKNRQMQALFAPMKLLKNFSKEKFC
ncbi:uracil-DNA glycosylase [Undibacterium sp. MH2W]|uniref:uracil-DNA glycosylase n=1 Tax=Undibacterium sp. MH2W TaxID=3413044 RepID=UPI003BF2770C